MFIKMTNKKLRNGRELAEQGGPTGGKTVFGSAAFGHGHFYMRADLLLVECEIL